MTLRESLNHVMDRGAQAHVHSCIYNVYYRHRSGTFPEVMNAYGDVIRELLELPKKTNTDDHIILKSVVNDDNNEECVDVYLLNTTDNETYSLDFIEWSDLVDLVIEDQIGLSTSDIVAHILWEITFWGMNKDDIELEKKRTLEATEDIGAPSETLNIDDLLD